MTEREKTRAAIASRYPRWNAPREKREPRKITAHEAAINLLAEKHPGSQRTGMMKALKKAMPEVDKRPMDERHPGWSRHVMECEDSSPCPSEWQMTFGDFRRIPDLYLVEAERQTLTCFEVEDSNPLTTSKKNDYWGLFWALDEYYWKLVVVRTDRDGNVTATTSPALWSTIYAELEMCLQ